jgi:hypothetical protein
MKGEGRMEGKGREVTGGSSSKHGEGRQEDRKEGRQEGRKEGRVTSIKHTGVKGGKLRPCVRIGPRAVGTF